MEKTTFYINDFYYIKSDDEIDVSDIPPLLRRKLSPVDKVAISTLNKIFSSDVEEIVFSSAYGEITRLKSIISQYQEFNEVSPAQFSGSVHNYAAGFFTLYKKINIPYYALASGENSVSAGMVKTVLSDKNNILFCYADNAGVSCIVNKREGKIKCTFEPSPSDCPNELEAFADFLDGKSNLFKTKFGIFERIKK